MQCGAVGVGPLMHAMWGGRGGTIEANIISRHVLLRVVQKSTCAYGVDPGHTESWDNRRTKNNQRQSLCGHDGLAEFEVPVMARREALWPLCSIKYRAGSRHAAHDLPSNVSLLPCHAYCLVISDHVF